MESDRLSMLGDRPNWAGTAPTADYCIAPRLASSPCAATPDARHGFADNTPGLRQAGIL
jgi:hypothetical protein